MTREPRTQDSESPVAATFLPVQLPATIGPEALPEAPVITEEVPSPVATASHRAAVIRHLAVQGRLIPPASFAPARVR